MSFGLPGDNFVVTQITKLCDFSSNSSVNLKRIKKYHYCNRQKTERGLKQQLKSRVIVNETEWFWIRKHKTYII